MEKTFEIEDDKQADWALEKIREEEAEAERLEKLATAKISELENQIFCIRKKCENSTKFLKGALRVYLDKVKSKETKTQRSYTLLNGSIVEKKPCKKMVKNDNDLLNYVKEYAPQFIEMTEKVKWDKMKKSLVISKSGEVVNAETGEVVSGVVVEDVPASFSVKFNKIGTEADEVEAWLDQKGGD